MKVCLHPVLYYVRNAWGQRVQFGVRSKIPLRLMLTIPFVVQTVGIVGLVGYLSYRSGRQAIEHLATHLTEEIGDRIAQNLKDYLTTPQTLAQSHRATIQLGHLDWQDFPQVEAFFIQHLIIHEDVDGLMLATENRDFLAVWQPEADHFVIQERNPAIGTLEQYPADLEGNRLALQSISEGFDPHQVPPDQPWYPEIKTAKTGQWRFWVSSLQGEGQPVRAIAYLLPFRDAQGRVQGVLGSSIFLEQVGDFLQNLHIGHTGQSLILDDQGRIVVSSTPEWRDRPTQWPADLETRTFKSWPTAAAESVHPLTRAAAEWGLAQQNAASSVHEAARMKLEDTPYFGYVIPFPLDHQTQWTIVVVVPETDFMDEIQASLHRTMLLSGLALLSVVGLNIWMADRMTRSLRHLTQATQSFAQGNTQPVLPPTRIAEVETLTDAFRQMAIALQQAEQSRRQYEQSLEAQVAEKTARQQALLSVIPDLMYIVDTQGVILDHVTSNLEIDLFESDESWVGKTIRDVGSPEVVQRKVEAIAQARATGKVQTYEQQIEQEGRSHYEEVKCVPMTGDRFLFVFHDITLYKQTELALRESELKFSHVFHTSPDPVWIATLAEGRFLNVNDRMTTFLGYARDELLGRVCFDLGLWANPEDLQTIRQILAAEGRVQDFETVFRLRSGEHRTILLSAIVSHLSGQDCVVGSLKDISDRKRAETALAQAKQQLEDRLSDLNQRNQEMVLLSKISDFLQSCLTLEEAYESIAHLIEPLFPQCSGGIFVVTSPQGWVKAVSTWGTPLNSQLKFHLSCCWALRQGQPHRVGLDHLGLCCNHILDLNAITTTLCIPMIAQGEILGLFYLSAGTLEALSVPKQQLAWTVAEQMALAIANLHLRETLRQQSIRDPLTGLYNRRYLEESLKQELVRAQRHQHPVGIIMMDVDHFKFFNDTFGHEAGDHVLQVVGTLLKQNVRGSDIACRYGGEEMMLVLPETSLAETRIRAEQIRAAIAQLLLTHNGKLLGKLTVSLGVSAFPQHGLTGATLIQAADKALYCAKAAGRNQVAIAPPTLPSL
jgi:diguanylate cyclase (GGDEF)-like protein/PAS domain S-box-containing protein